MGSIPSAPTVAKQLKYGEYIMVETKKNEPKALGDRLKNVVNRVVDKVKQLLGK